MVSLLLTMNIIYALFYCFDSLFEQVNAGWVDLHFDNNRNEKYKMRECTDLLLLLKIS